MNNNPIENKKQKGYFEEEKGPSGGGGVSEGKEGKHVQNTMIYICVNAIMKPVILYTN